ncbi:MAG TPA: SpoIIE family protein phosphatase [Candidatus Saccharimonadales bacterium]|nr:SpoIIE family protein phosphatase [Candidatus Saccharimonadales bacterium]
MTAVAYLRSMWDRTSRLDLGALLLAVAGGLAYLFEAGGSIFNYLKFIALLAALYLFYRMLVWGRDRLLWSLRNRLIVAGLFIAVVPVLLLLLLAARSASILYSQLASYLLYEDIQRRKDMLADITAHIAAAHSTLPAGISEAESERVLAAQSQSVHDRELPGLTIEFSDNATLLRNIARGNQWFSGLFQEGETLSIISIRALPERKGTRVVTMRVPVKPDFLASIAPDLGAIQLNLMQRYVGGTRQGVLYTTNGVPYETTHRIVASNRFLQPGLLWIDSPVNVVSRLDSTYVGPDGAVEFTHPVLAVFNARPSQLSSRMFGSLGELRDTYLIAFVLILIAFLVIWAGAFITGIVLTRQITKAVDDLYKATQDVKRGDLSHRVRIERRDQLGVLGESFNDMIGSVSTLIQEQQQRQRLENEISIAREVQDQLFPRILPQVPGVEIEAICKAAREVSGDYYDFIQLSPTHMAIAIADISGKGISAALLMASLQAALRSQVLVDGSEHMSTAELVSRLNKHLVRNTGDDRFATFFIAVYDSASRNLRYTNAGHLPSFLICKDSALQLDKGGMVLGVVEDYLYEEGSVIVAPDSLLVGYSDGLVEPENVYGEEFGIRRLQQAAVHVQGASPHVVAESLMTAAEEWAGTPEQADDMTVIVARLR